MCLANLAKCYTVAEAAMKVNMLEAKSQLSRLVKEALEGEDVVIASNGEPMVKLVPVARKGRLRGWGKLKKLAGSVDAAFTPEIDAEVARGLDDRS
jgi:prevent-host-death family protein